MDEKRYRLLTRIAIVLTVAWVGWTILDSGLNQSAPGAYKLDAARKNLEDGRFDEALSLYREALKADSENLGALRGMAQALTQLGAQAEQREHAKAQDQTKKAAQSLNYYKQAMTYYNEAISREEAPEPSPLRQRIRGVAYANRGILQDRMGNHSGALSDYTESIRLEPEVADGPGLLTRFMRNQAERPPSVADRARYLAAELSKPEEERVLRIPTLDARQRAYSMD